MDFDRGGAGDDDDPGPGEGWYGAEIDCPASPF